MRRPGGPLENPLLRKGGFEGAPNRAAWEARYVTGPTSLAQRSRPGWRDPPEDVDESRAGAWGDLAVVQNLSIARFQRARRLESEQKTSLAATACALGRRGAAEQTAALVAVTRLLAPAVRERPDASWGTNRPDELERTAGDPREALLGLGVALGADPIAVERDEACPTSPPTSAPTSAP